MRTINIDLSSDQHIPQRIFGGYAGEHNESNLVVSLPVRMISEDIYCYYFEFQTTAGEHIVSPDIFPNKLSDGSKISINLWEQLVPFSGDLRFCVTAVLHDADGNIAVKGKTAMCTLQIFKSPVGEDTLLDAKSNKEALEEILEESMKGYADIQTTVYPSSSVLSIDNVNSAKIISNIAAPASTNQVYVYGKNLIDNSKYITTQKISGVNITYLPDEDAYLFDGTVTSTSGIAFQLSSSLPIYVNGANYVGYCQKLSGSISNTDIYCTLQFRVADTAPTGPVVGNAKGTVQVGKGAIGEEVRSTSTNIIQNNYIYDIGLYTQAGQTFNSLKVKLMLSLQKPSNFPYVPYIDPVSYPISNNTSYIIIPEDGGIVALNTPGTISGTANKILINEAAYRDYSGISAIKNSLRSSNDNQIIYATDSNGNQSNLTWSTYNPDANTVAVRTNSGTLKVATPALGLDAANKSYVDGLVGNINSVLAALVDVSSNTTQADESQNDETVLSEPTIEEELS